MGRTLWQALGMDRRFAPWWKMGNWGLLPGLLFLFTTAEPRPSPRPGEETPPAGRHQRVVPWRREWPASLAEAGPEENEEAIPKASEEEDQGGNCPTGGPTG
ncbi:hypothetical protein F5883DRAFT_552652 [Diaporthe sp. PMI_573]|nr:hypothetical protein F5883DRAFT_552652 [Diaporthaceae sp. PMI_573]